MTYQEYKPDNLLNDFIKCYWRCENSTNQQLDFAILPDGCFDLIISLDNFSIKSILLTGLWSKKIDISIAANTHLFAIRFRLLSVEYILKQNISALINTEIQIDNIFFQLHKLRFDNISIAIERLNNIFLATLGSAKGIDHRKQNLFNMLYKTNGNQTIQEYSKSVFWQSRQINRYFTEKFGISLKAYCNILKCHASYKQIKDGQLFPEQNYFDQSHFIKEIIKHTGHNPSELYQNKNDRFLQLTTMTKK